MYEELRSFNAIFPVLDGEGHQASNTLIIYTYKLVMKAIANLWFPEM